MGGACRPQGKFAKKPFESKLQLKKISQKEENGERFGGFWDETELSEVFLWASCRSQHCHNLKTTEVRVLSGVSKCRLRCFLLQIHWDSFGITVLEIIAANFSPLALPETFLVAKREGKWEHFWVISVKQHNIWAADP